MNYKIPNLKKLSPIKGLCYSPSPKDNHNPPPPKYFDSDWTNSTFPLIWGSENKGRGDLANIAGIGVNFLHLYDWSVPPAPGAMPGPYQRSHLSFLKECARTGIHAFIPISNFFMEEIAQGKGSEVKGYMKAMVREVYAGGKKPVAGAGMWGFGNEFDLATTFGVEEVVKAMAFLVEIEKTMQIPHSNLLPVTSPVSFAATKRKPPGIAQVAELQRAILKHPALGQEFWEHRIVASLNSFNGGGFLSNYIRITFPKYFPELPFFFSELGISISSGGPARNEREQADFVLGQLRASRPCGNFLGACVFQFLNQTALKTGTEATFGANKYLADALHGSGKIPVSYIPGGGQSYPINVLQEKPMFNSIRTGYMVYGAPVREVAGRVRIELGKEKGPDATEGGNDGGGGHGNEGTVPDVPMVKTGVWVDEQGNYELIGRVLNPDGVPIEGVEVTAMDKDLITRDDFLGKCETDETGLFRITFNPKSFRELFFDRRPDIYFKLSRSGWNLGSTRKKPIKNAKDGDGPIELCIEE